MSVVPRGEWLPLARIYTFVEASVQLNYEDLSPSAKGTTDLTWMRKVRNALQYRKGTGEIIWARQTASYMLPLSEDEEVITSRNPIKGGLTQAEFEKLQQRFIEIGHWGEEFVMNRERDTLREAGRSDLADRVVRVSVENVGAGYDIKSYDAEGAVKLIEVKTTTGRGSTFELTANELETAKRECRKYWIHFVREIGSDEPDVIYIHDPAGTGQAKLTLTPSSYRVRLNSD